MTRRSLFSFLVIMVLLVGGNVACEPVATKVSMPKPESTVVAQIGDKTITGAEFRQAYLAQLRPGSPDEVPNIEPVSLDAVLKKMVVEQILILDARKQGLLGQDAATQESLEKYRKEQYFAQLIQKHVVPLVDVNDAEVQAAMKRDAKLNEAQARLSVQKQKGQQALQQFYRATALKRNLTSHKESFAQVAKLHARLLNQPRETRSQSWILNRQIREELTDEEKAIVMVSFDTGTFTALDWFSALGDLSPPGRPRNFNTPAGVEAFLQRSLQMPVLAAEAVALGLDQDPSVQKRIREYEDMRLRNKLMVTYRKKVGDPNESEVKAYYDLVKDRIEQRHEITALTVWCQDQATAKRVLTKAREGADFEALIKEEGLTTERKQPEKLYLYTEGPYWPQAWAAEPNDIVGPVLGFYADKNNRTTTLKWRVLKVTEKQVGEAAQGRTDYDKEMIKYRLQSDKIDQLMEQDATPLFPVYPHEVHYELLPYFDPRRVP